MRRHLSDSPFRKFQLVFTFTLSLSDSPFENFKLVFTVTMEDSKKDTASFGVNAGVNHT